MATETGTAKAKKVQKAHVTPSAETNQRVMKECVTVVVNIKKIMATFNCSYKDAIVLGAAAENGLLPTNPQSAKK